MYGGKLHGRWRQERFNSVKVSNILSFQGQSAIHMATLTRGQKSFTTKWLEKRYKGLLLNVVVLEGMFLINTVPLGTHSKMFCDVLSCHTLWVALRKWLLYLIVHNHIHNLQRHLSRSEGMLQMHFHQTINTHTSLTTWLFKPSCVKICLVGLVNVNW